MRTVLVCSLLLLAAAGACGTAPVPTDQQLGCVQPSKCSVKSDCCGNSVCRDSTCRAPCAADSECGTGGQCLDGTCRNCTDNACTSNTQCCGKTLCAGGSCRVVCLKDADCSGGFCYLDKPDDLSPTCHKNACTCLGANCSSSSTCCGSGRCTSAGLCLQPCSKQADCTEAACVGTSVVCESDGFCHPKL